MDTVEFHKRLDESDEFTQDEMNTLKALLDPVMWAENTLSDPENPTKKLSLRYYQRDTLKFQPIECVNEKGEHVLRNRIKVYRFGRRVGKTLELAVEALHKACTNHNYRVIYIAPFESQCAIFFSMIEKLLTNTVIVPKRFVSKPYMCQFRNGSTIRAYTANVRSSRKGSTIRGTEGDLIILDEMDHGIDDVINEVIMPIFMGNDKATIVGASTPSGRRGLFYLWCSEGHKMGIKAYHFPSTVSPRWNSESDIIAKRSMTREQYIHEILAEFGEALEGVFKHKDLDAIMRVYSYNDLKYDQKKNRYIMGIDWNEQHGTCIVIVEQNRVTGKYKIFKNVIVPKQEFTQLEGIEKIKKLHAMYPCDFIYADHGFGSTQIELLKKEGINNPSTLLDKIIRDIDYGGIIEVRDPVTGQKIKKPAKPFLVDNSLLATEARNIIIPEDEDTEYGLIGQMRNFSVVKFSSSGHPVYSGKMNGVDNDHSLNAFMLAMVGYTLEFGDINKYETTNEIGKVQDVFAYAGYKRDTVGNDNIQKFKNLLERIAPNYVDRPYGFQNKSVAFISSRDQSNKEKIISKIRRRRFGIGRENI